LTILFCGISLAGRQEVSMGLGDIKAKVWNVDPKEVNVEEVLSSRGDEPTKEEIPDVVPLDTIPLVRSVGSVDAEIKDRCKEFAAAWWAEKKAAKAKDAAKARLLHLFEKRDITDWETDLGVFKVKVVKDSEGIVVAKVKAILTEEQIKEVTGVTRRGYTTLDFTPAAKEPRFGE